MLEEVRITGLGVTVDGARVLATLTPVKERELIVLGTPGADERTIDVGKAGGSIGSNHNRSATQTRRDRGAIPVSCGIGTA